MKDDLTLLRHIKEAIERIETYCAAGESDFYNDTRTQDAVIRNFEIIGEATKGLTIQTRDAYPTIPWRKIAGMRDFLIHVYFGVTLELVWETFEKEVPILKVAILDAIQKRNP